MNISEIHVQDFGAWHDLTLGELSPQATVFYGPNEAGKTTLLNVIRTVLYGFSDKRCKKYLPPAQGTRVGRFSARVRYFGRLSYRPDGHRQIMWGERERLPWSRATGLRAAAIC